MKIFLILLLSLLLLLLTGCLGPALITIAGFKVTAGTVITIPAKIEAFEKYKEKKNEEEKK
jgi:hypothetical protein